MKKIILILAFILTFSLVEALLIIPSNPPKIGIEYNFTENDTKYDDIYLTSTISLEVTTPDETDCYYTKIEGAIPGSSFENNWGTLHKQEIANLKSGIHKYYIRCGDVSSPVHNLTFKTDSLVYGEIEISKEPPLKEGTYELTLKTSKPVTNTPKLDFSFDGISYKPIVLLHESENIWKGYLIIERNLGKVTGSFKFEAEDFYEVKGNELKGDIIFLVDTNKPPIVSTIKSIGDVGQIKLKWFYEDDFEEFNIYRSQDPNIGPIDFYESTTEKEFVDNNVEKGKTYYYRISAVDKAENIGDLSIEISATALTESSSTQTGLRIDLRGKVENFINEIDFTINLINSIKSSISLKEEKERELFSFLEFDEELDDSKAELNSLKRDVESYKTQDLTKEELDNRINSASLKLNIIRKNVPENILISGERDYSSSINEENIQEAILLYNPLMEEKDYRKSIFLTKEMIKDMNIKISTVICSVDISYLDGTKKQFTIVEHSIDSILEKSEDTFLILSIPRNVADKTTELNLKNIDYEIIKEDVLLFYSDTKKISYYSNKKVDFEDIEELKPIPIKINTIEEGESLISGAFLLDYPKKTSYGIIIVIVFFMLLGTYLIYSSRNKNSEKIAPLLEKIENIKKLKKEENLNRIRLIYKSLKEDYKTLNKRQKKIISKKINELREIINGN